jgi:hypothetical protein
MVDLIYHNPILLSWQKYHIYSVFQGYPDLAKNMLLLENPQLVFYPIITKLCQNRYRILEGPQR